MTKKSALDTVPAETLIGPDDWVATWSEKQGYTVNMPDVDLDNVMPFGALVLMAAVIRLQNDKGFAMDMYHWMEDRFKELKV